ncbi:MAG TPA: DNA polymerase III subunit gamma/tau [Bacteroidales bacterium]
MENFIVSARKYRPATFRQVVGQQSITNTLQNAIKHEHLAQAFLFTGPRGVGKTTCARILAKTINCYNLNAEMEPCDKCESCTAFNNSASFNIYELDAASNNSVDDIRNLVEKVRIPPQVGKYKVYIIDEVHMLSAAAFNAFLKTLEEPPAYAKFILATTEKHKIIPTILSRCQIFDFRRISVEDIAGYLEYVAENENITADFEALHVIAQKADGALRDALSIFDQIVSFSGDQISYKNVIDNLNILDYEYYFKITDSILQNDISQLLLTFNDIIENGFDGQHFINGLSEHLRNLLVIKNPETLQLMHSSPSLKERYRIQSESFEGEWLLKALDLCNKYDLSYKASNNKRLHIEIALMLLGQISSGAAPVQQSFTKPIQAKKTELKEKAEPYQNKETKETKASNPAVSELKKNIDKTRPDEGNSKSYRNVSLKRPTKNPDVENDDSGDKQPEKNSDFSQDKLEVSWKKFYDFYHQKAPSFANAIAKYSPVLKENFEIEYKVDNILIAKDTLNVLALQEFLKNELDNTNIKLNAVLPPKEEKKVAYTDREKFDELAQKYPGVKTLKEQLDLEIEF